MEKKDLIIGVVGLAVCVIVAATVLMPILSDATKTTYTFTNEGIFRMAYTDKDFTFEWNYDNPTTYVLNGESIVFNNTTNRDVSVAMSDKFFIRGDKTNVAVYFNGDVV